MGVYGLFYVSRKVFPHYESGIIRQQSETLFYCPPRGIRATKHGHRPRILFDHHFGPCADAGQQPGKIPGGLSL